jgi:hypothetical protein
MLTISKLKRRSINYYNDTAKAVGQAANDLQRANGGLGEYYSERETRTPVWLLAGDKLRAARLVGLSATQQADGEADAEVVARWLDDGAAPNSCSGTSSPPTCAHRPPTRASPNARGSPTHRPPHPHCADAAS